MAADAVLGLLGLARRANKLACGEDKVKEMYNISPLCIYSTFFLSIHILMTSYLILLY